MGTMGGFLGFLLLGMGSLCLLIGFIFLYFWWHRHRHCCQLTAKVVENLRRRGPRGSTYYHPLLEFEYRGGAKRLESPLGNPWEVYQPGQQLTICYDGSRDCLAPGLGRRAKVAGLSFLILALMLLTGGMGLLLTLL